jgi:surfactin synthase thioesterase subunit
MIQGPVDYDLWCRRYRPARNGAGQLVCFPHAGGAATFYLPVSAALSPAVDVVAIQYPGRQDRHREPLVDDIARLADRIDAVLRAPDGASVNRPLTFFGHSMGAVVAFEVARRLEADGRGPVRIFASGRRAPSTTRNETIHLRDDAGILAEVRSMNGTAEAILQEDEIMRSALPALRADYRAIETYACAREATVSCPISVMFGDDDPKVTIDEANAWARHTTGDFDARTFAGGHFYLVNRASEVLTILRQHFDVD